MATLASEATPEYVAEQKRVYQIFLDSEVRPLPPLARAPLPFALWRPFLSSRRAAPRRAAPRARALVSAAALRGHRPEPLPPHPCPNADSRYVIKIKAMMESLSTRLVLSLSELRAADRPAAAELLARPLLQVRSPRRTRCLRAPLPPPRSSPPHSSPPAAVSLPRPPPPPAGAHPRVGGQGRRAGAGPGVL